MNALTVMHTVSVTVELVPEKCITCGVVFGIDADLRDQFKRTGKSFYCPSGHGQHFTETTEQRLRKQLADMTRYRDNAVANATHARDQYDAERKAHASTKGQLTRTRKRIAVGVCPCCHRSFVNLGRHMAGQHPDYAQETTS